MTGVGLGWIQGTVRKTEPTLVIDVIASAFAAVPEPRNGGTRWYSESVNVGAHTMIGWSPRSRPDVVETYFEVRQTGLDELGGEGSVELLSTLLAAGARFTRVDGHYDDLARHVEPPAVAQAFRDRMAVSHVRAVRELRGWVVADGIDGARPNGATTYLGSTSSEAMIRVYDKAAESGRLDAGVRWEVQMRNGRGQQFAAGVITAGEGLGTYIIGCIRGLVDFRERGNSIHGERTPLLGWWAAIVGDAERVRLNTPIKVDSLERRAAWVHKQAAPTLALLARLRHGLVERTPARG